MDIVRLEFVRGAARHAGGARPGEPGTTSAPPYVGHRGWIGVHLNKGLDWNEIAGAIEDAYLTVAPSGS